MTPIPSSLTVRAIVCLGLISKRRVEANTPPRLFRLYVKKYGDMPSRSLYTQLYSLQQQGFIAKEDGGYIITPEGSALLESVRNATTRKKK